MERGFKSRCEQIAKSVRHKLDLSATAPLSADALASHMGVSIWLVTDLGLSDADIEQLTVLDVDAWSAVTVQSVGREAIIVNPAHRSGRYASDVMHELAHLMLAHEPSRMFFVGDSELALRGFNKDVEDEANWLAGALLLPRDALVKIHSRRISADDACEQYGVSKQMLNFRINVTGVKRQFKRRRPSGARAR